MVLGANRMSVQVGEAPLQLGKMQVELTVM
jgi:hypothetical protein